MIGTLVNVITVITGSIVGTLLNRGIKQRYIDRTMQGLGLVAISLGTTWIVQNINQSKSPLLFIICIVVGAILGEFIDLDSKTKKLSSKFSKKGKPSPINGLITIVLLSCIGTMSILGSIDASLNNNHTLLYTNAVLDGFTSLVMASSFGITIIWSALIIFLWQGSIYLLAGSIATYTTPEIMGEVSIIGGILILATGINILGAAKIKTLNLLPALFLPVIYFIPPIYNFVGNILRLF